MNEQKAAQAASAAKKTNDEPLLHSAKLTASSNLQPSTLGAWFDKERERGAAPRSIVISGLPRGGTSLAASIFANIGVPFMRPREHVKREGKAVVSARYEHFSLGEALQNDDFQRIAVIAQDFYQTRGTWAWKCPDICRSPEPIRDALPNPHFVLIFKDPVSVAIRSRGFREKGWKLERALVNVTRQYAKLAQFAAGSGVPVLLLSYEKVMLDLAGAIAVCAEFAGLPQQNATRVAAEVALDAQHYFAGGDPAARAQLLAARRTRLWPDAETVYGDEAPE